MDPERLKEEYSSLLDGELSPEEREAIEAELADNAEALRELEHMKQVDQLYRQLPRQQAPAALGDRVHEAIQPRSKVTFGRKRSIRHAVWPMVLAAAAMVMIMVGYFVWLPQAGEPMQLASTPAAEAPQTDRYLIEEVREAPALAEKGAPVMGDEAAEATEEGGFEEFSYDQGGSASGAVGGGIAGREAPMAKGGYGGGLGDMQFKGEAFDGERADQKMSRGAGIGGVAELEAAEVPRDSGDLAGARRDQAAPMAMRQAPAAAQAEAAPPATAGDLNNPAGQQMLQQAPPGPPLKGEAPEAPGDVPPPPAPAEALLAMPAPEPAPPAMTEEREPVTAPDRAEQRVAGARAFTLVDGVWTQEGYAGEETVALGEGSQALRERFEAVPDLRDLLTFDRPVIFRLDDAWYRLEPRQEKTVPE